MNKTKIIISPYSGFCFGVKRALDIADKALKKERTVYSLGPIIHNPEVVDEFSKRGLRIVKNINKIDSGNATVLIPSHGIDPKVLRKKSIRFIDTTCPLVNRVQKIVERLKKAKYYIVIVGDRKHPEVKGLRGIAGRKSVVVKNRTEAKAIKVKDEKVALISQTTAALRNFNEISSELAKKNFKKFVGFNTVCKNTLGRQKEARRIARQVDVMFVVGGRNSANTARLAEICKEVNRNTFHIECGKDLRKSFIKNKNKIGIATGASTPPYAIKKIIERIRRFDI